MTAEAPVCLWAEDIENDDGGFGRAIRFKELRDYDRGFGRVRRMRDAS